MEKATLTAVGLMSGTSVDAIDVALIETDGETVRALGTAASIPLDPDLRGRLRAAMAAAAGMPFTATVPASFHPLARELAQHHVDAIKAAGIDLKGVDIVGFHGQTIRHAPRQGVTWQVGDSAHLAAALKVPVVGDFRLADVAAGGEGAPFVPLYHCALAGNMPDVSYPLAVLNIGGVANITWIGDGGARVIACDTGPGNALLDDWMTAHGAGPCDLHGAVAARGQADEERLQRWLRHPYFARSAPKSLDRDDFAAVLEENMGLEDGAATLTAFTAAAIARTAAAMPEAPKRFLVTGGGRHNPTLMTALKARLQTPVMAVEDVGWRGDYLEAEAFAFLAVRSLKGLPLSLPETTGVPMPMPGGRVFRP